MLKHCREMKWDNNRQAHGLYSIIFLFILASFSCLAQQAQKGLYIEVVDMDYKKDGTYLGDTITLKFNVYKDKDKSSEKRGFFLDDNTNDMKVTAADYINGNISGKPFEFVPGSLKNLKMSGNKSEIPDDIVISLLVDRSGSIDTGEMRNIRDAIRSFVYNLPDGCLYYSWFHNDISASVPLTRSNFEEIDMTTSSKNTALYNAIYTKLLEFDPDSIIPNMSWEQYYSRNEELSKRKSNNRYLIVLTDGENDVDEIPKYYDDGFREITFPDLQVALQRYKNKVKVYTLGYGENSNHFDEDILKLICEQSGNPNGYFLAKPDSILELFKVTITDKLQPDYEIKLINAPKTYTGESRELSLEIVDPGVKDGGASGSWKYAFGAPSKPVRVAEIDKRRSIWEELLIGLAAAFVFYIVVMIIVQLIVPLIKNKIFLIKYVKKGYKPKKHEILKTCQYCELSLTEPIKNDYRVVTKCNHVVHWKCWEHYEHQCPEYGQNCNDGKQDYFDISDPFSRKNKTYYLKWVNLGLFGGFISWVIFMFIKDLPFIDNMSHSLIDTLKNIEDEDAKILFIDKIGSLLVIGTVLGLFLSSFFNYAEEYRRKTIQIILRILLRGLIGCIAGFVTFLAGCSVLVLLGISHTDVFLDLIPWILFGISIGLLLSIKTTIVWKHGILGGLISIIFCFFILYFMSSEFAYWAILIGFMIYSAGLGLSIATVRSRAENFFLKVLQGSKEGETIPIHKWLSNLGGHNEVYIGKAFSCEIQMNWEKNNLDVGERHAKIYINTSRNIPVIVSLEKGKPTHYNDRFDLNYGKEYDLLNGYVFKIGNTVFQYIEKD